MDQILQQIEKALDGPEDSEPAGDFLLNPWHSFRFRAVSERIAAAVLIAIRTTPQGAYVILTRRSDHLIDHAGQIAFPGGKMTKKDHGPRETALRESHEEINLDPAKVDIIGTLPDYHSRSGYIITPIVGKIGSEIKLAADPDEVAEIFEVPLEYLIRRGNFVIKDRHIGGEYWKYYSITYEDRVIWGITAGLLWQLGQTVGSI